MLEHKRGQTREDKHVTDWTYKNKCSSLDCSPVWGVPGTHVPVSLPSGAAVLTVLALQTETGPRCCLKHTKIDSWQNSWRSNHLLVCREEKVGKRLTSPLDQCSPIAWGEAFHLPPTHVQYRFVQPVNSLMHSHLLLCLPFKKTQPTALVICWESAICSIQWSWSATKRWVGRL